MSILSIAAVGLFASLHPDVSTPEWRDLIAKDLTNCETPKEAVWYFDAEGNLTATKDINLITKGDYENFALDLEYKMDTNANAGVFLYASDIKDWIPNKLEIQLIDDTGSKWTTLTPIQKNCSMYGHKAPLKANAKPVGEWNRLTIFAEGQRIRVVQNGEVVLEADLAEHSDVKINPDGSEAPKWHTKAYSTLPTRGRIGFQGCHGGVATKFRNIKIKEMKK